MADGIAQRAANRPRSRAGLGSRGSRNLAHVIARSRVPLVSVPSVLALAGRPLLMRGSSIGIIGTCAGTAA
jgi:hypothetical protein